MKTVKTYGNLSEAGFASSLLEAAGIRAFLADEQTFTIGYGVGVGQIRLQVEDADWDRAIQVLEHGPDAAALAAPSAEMESAAAEPGRIPIGLFVAVAVFFCLLAFAVHHAIGSKRTAARSSEQTYEYDCNHDRKPDHFVTYLGDRMVRATADRNFDGKIDEWETYDANGMIERVEEDNNFDGKPDGWIIYKNGAPTVEKRDSDFNGRVDWILTFQNGILTRMESAPNESAPVYRRYFFTNGVLREEWVDENRDGTFDYKILHDPFGTPSAPSPIEGGK